MAEHKEWGWPPLLDLGVLQTLPLGQPFPPFPLIKLKLPILHH